MKFGAHCSTAGGVWKALERAASIGCEVVQIFVKNNMQWLGRAPSADDVKKFAAERGKFSAVFGHAGYLINIAAPPSANRDKSVESLIQEMEFATALGLPFLVLHPGAHLGAGEDEGIAQAVEALDEVLAATKKSKVRIALENTAGQGTYLGNRVEHLAAIFNGVKRRERLALCLDTAHLFAAGFDLRAPAGWDEAMHLIDKLIGLREIAAFHLNDSKTGLGSRVDRHEHIGQGKIGLEGFRHLVNDARFAGAPGCLETPKSDDLHEDVENLKTLRGLAGPR
jgi:deoxyribonuclease-4